MLGAEAARVTDTNDGNYPDYGDAVIHLRGDLIFRLPSTRFAETTSACQPTWMYLFTYRSTSTVKRYDSAHSMEIPFVFGVLDYPAIIVFTGRDEHREQLMKQVQQAWISFARRGDPSHPGLPAWPTNDTKTRATMELGLSSRPVSDPFAAERQAWASVPFDGVTPTVDQMFGLLPDHPASP